MNSLQKMEHKPTADLITTMIKVHCLTIVTKNLGWYMLSGCLSNSAASELSSSLCASVKSLAPFADTVLEGFNLPPIPELYAPIARDYAKFNTQSDMDDVRAAGEIFKAKM